MNITKIVPNVLNRKLARSLLIGQKHSPNIMFVAGVAGVVVTTVLASKATLRVDEVLEAMEKKRNDIDQALELGKASSAEFEYSEQDHKHDTIIIKRDGAIALIKLYSPAVGAGILTIGLLTGSHVVLTRRNAAVTAAYAAMSRGFEDYRKRVIADVGEEKDRQYRYAGEDVTVVTEGKNGPETSVIQQPGIDGASIYAVYFDQNARDWSPEPGRNQFFIKCQQNYMNDLLQHRGHVFLNEVYDALGLPRTKAGQLVGWVVGHGDEFIDLGVFSNDVWRGQRFVNGEIQSILIDPNVNGVVYHLLDN